MEFTIVEVVFPNGTKRKVYFGVVPVVGDDIKVDGNWYRVTNRAITTSSIALKVLPTSLYATY